jgi:hypothetical protein
MAAQHPQQLGTNTQVASAPEPLRTREAMPTSVDCAKAHQVANISGLALVGPNSGVRVLYNSSPPSRPRNRDELRCHPETPASPFLLCP